MRLKAAWRQKSHWRQGRTSLGPTSNLEGKGNTECVKIIQTWESKFTLFLMDNPGLNANDLSVHVMLSNAMTCLLCSCYIYVKYCSLDAFIVNRCLG